MLERPTYIEDPGEGPSTRLDSVYIEDDDDDDETAACMIVDDSAAAADTNGLNRSAVVSETASKKSSANQDKEASIADLQAEEERSNYKLFMEDMMSYI